MKSMYVMPTTEEMTILGRDGFMQDSLLYVASSSSNFGGGSDFDYGE